MLIKTFGKVLIEAVTTDTLVFFLILRGKHSLFAWITMLSTELMQTLVSGWRNSPLFLLPWKFFFFNQKWIWGFVPFLLHILRWAILALTNWKQFLELDMGSSSPNHILGQQAPEQNEWQQWILGRNQEHPVTCLLCESTFSYLPKRIIQLKLRCPKYIHLGLSNLLYCLIFTSFTYSVSPCTWCTYNRTLSLKKYVKCIREIFMRRVTNLPFRLPHEHENRVLYFYTQNKCYNRGSISGLGDIAPTASYVQFFRVLKFSIFLRYTLW